MPSISASTKKRGRPATGKGVQVVVRFQPIPLAALDAWIARQPNSPTRPEAVRRLVEVGLSVEASASRQSRAKEE